MSEYESFFGLNETHFQKEIQKKLIGSQLNDKEKHEKQYSPFFKHSNCQFTIQKEKVVWDVIDHMKEVDQYFYMTDDNQYMLVYPNYRNEEQKRSVIMQLARRF